MRERDRIKLDHFHGILEACEWFFNGGNRSDLLKQMLDALIALSRTRHPGLMIRTSTVAGELRRMARATGSDTYQAVDPSELTDCLMTMTIHMGNVMARNEFIGDAEKGRGPVWYMTDNTAIFQSRIAPHIFRPSTIPLSPSGPEPRAMVQALNTLEGDMAERFAADWLVTHPQAQWSHFRALAPASKGHTNPDIDGLARLGNGSSDDNTGGRDDLLVLVNVKCQS